MVIKRADSKLGYVIIAAILLPTFAVIAWSIFASRPTMQPQNLPDPRNQERVAKAPRPILDRPAVEKTLKEMDKARMSAEFMEKLNREMEMAVYDLIRLQGRESAKESIRRLWEFRSSYCEEEGKWRLEFKQLEEGLKTNNNGSLPSWVKENREWQKLDAAMKRDTVNVSPEKCKEIYAEYLR